VCFRAAVKRTPVHTYAHLDNVDIWFDIYAAPLNYEDGDRSYCAYTATPSGNADFILNTISTAQTSNDVLKTCIKLHKATNFDTNDTMRIKETLELTTFFVSSHIARYKVLKRLKHMSYTDALTGLSNRFACTEYIADLVSRGEKFAAVSIDDFGTGYSSLSYLSKIPANLLKIDKSFIDRINTNESSKQYVAAMISMGHIMGLEVISEGVEQPEQIEALRSVGCDLIQGFIWGRPMSAEDVGRLVADITSGKS